MNNGDNIRSRDNDRLAIWLSMIVDCHTCPHFVPCAEQGFNCLQTWRQWLNQEIK